MSDDENTLDPNMLDQKLADMGSKVKDVQPGDEEADDDALGGDDSYVSENSAANIEDEKKEAGEIDAGGAEGRAEENDALSNALKEIGETNPAEGGDGAPATPDDDSGAAANESVGDANEEYSGGDVPDQAGESGGDAAEAAPANNAEEGEATAVTAEEGGGEAAKGATDGGATVAATSEGEAVAGDEAANDSEEGEKEEENRAGGEPESSNPDNSTVSNGQTTPNEVGGAEEGRPGAEDGQGNTEAANGGATSEGNTGAGASKKEGIHAGKGTEAGPGEGGENGAAGGTAGAKVDNGGSDGDAQATTASANGGKTIIENGAFPNGIVPLPPPSSPPPPLTRKGALAELKMKLLPVNASWGSPAREAPKLMRDGKGKIFARLPPPPANISIEDVKGQIQSMAQEFQGMKDGRHRRRNAPPRKRRGRNGRGPPGARERKIPAPTTGKAAPLSPEQEMKQLEGIRDQRKRVETLATSWGVSTAPLVGGTPAPGKSKYGRATGKKARKKDKSTAEGGAQVEAEEKEDPLHCVFSRVRELLQANLTRVIDMFRSMDTNGDGVLEKKEMSMGLGNLGFTLTKGEMTNLWHAFDKDNSGSVEYKELYQILRDSVKDSVDAEELLDNGEGSKNMTAKERRQREYQLRVQRGKKESNRERKAARKRILMFQQRQDEKKKAEESVKQTALTQRTVSSKISEEASKRARAMARKRIAEKKKKTEEKERKKREAEEKALKQKIVEQQGMAAVGHMRIVKRLNKRIHKVKSEIQLENKMEEQHGMEVEANTSNDKVEQELRAFQESRKHSELARETKRRLRKQKMRAVKLREEEKQYQRDKLRMYQMHRNYMEEVGASVGATVVSPVRVPRRNEGLVLPDHSVRPKIRKEFLYKELRDLPTGQPSPDAVQRAEEELGARRRDESLEVLFQQAKRIEAPAFVAGEGIGNDRVMNLFKEGHTGGPLSKSVSSPVLPVAHRKPKPRRKVSRGKNPWRNRAAVPIKKVEEYTFGNERSKMLIAEDGPRWKEFKESDNSVSSPLSHAWLEKNSAGSPPRRRAKKKYKNESADSPPLVSMEPIEGGYAQQYAMSQQTGYNSALKNAGSSMIGGNRLNSNVGIGVQSSVSLQHDVNPAAFRAKYEQMKKDYL